MKLCLWGDVHLTKGELTDTESTHTGSSDALHRPAARFCKQRHVSFVSAILQFCDFLQERREASSLRAKADISGLVSSILDDSADLSLGLR